MNAAEFFMANFGRHFLPESSGNAFQDMEQVLTRTYVVPGKFTNGKPTKDGSIRPAVPQKSRLSFGWAIIRPGSATMRQNLAVEGIEFSELPPTAAFQKELETWDGKEPRIFLGFDKKTIDYSQVFLTVDKRCVRLCNASGTETKNWELLPPGTKPPRQPAKKKPATSPARTA